MVWVACFKPSILPTSKAFSCPKHGNPSILSRKARGKFGVGRIGWAISISGLLLFLAISGAPISAQNLTTSTEPSPQTSILPEPVPDLTQTSNTVPTQSPISSIEPDIIPIEAILHTIESDISSITQDVGFIKSSVKSATSDTLQISSIMQDLTSICPGSAGNGQPFV